MVYDAKKIDSLCKPLHPMLLVNSSNLNTFTRYQLTTRCSTGREPCQRNTVHCSDQSFIGWVMPRMQRFHSVCLCISFQPMNYSFLWSTQRHVKLLFSTLTQCNHPAVDGSKCKFTSHKKSINFAAWYFSMQHRSCLLLGDVSNCHSCMQCFLEIPQTTCIYCRKVTYTVPAYKIRNPSPRFPNVTKAHIDNCSGQNTLSSFMDSQTPL